VVSSAPDSTRPGKVRHINGVGVGDSVGGDGVKVGSGGGVWMIGVKLGSSNWSDGEQAESLARSAISSILSFVA